jgi:hypothetical protein
MGILRRRRGPRRGTAPVQDEGEALLLATVVALEQLTD